jgi:hypothetical protein
MRKFTISTTHSGRKRSVEVRVYGTLATMRRAASFDKWDKILGPKREGAQLTDAGAVTTPVFVMQVAKDGSEIHEAMCGVVRVVSGHVNTEVVSHEMVHMASAIYREDVEPVKGGVFDSMENEEVLCYIAGDLTRKAWVKLFEAGY